MASSTEGPQLSGDDLWIRTTNEGDQARFAYSTDGQTYRRRSARCSRSSSANGPATGWASSAGTTSEAAGHIDVDYFHYDYDGPRGTISE